MCDFVGEETVRFEATPLQLLFDAMLFLDKQRLREQPLVLLLFDATLLLEEPLLFEARLFGSSFLPFEEGLWLLHEQRILDK
jgi:hypothetical protein